MGGGLCATERRSAPLPGLRLPGRPDTGRAPRSPQHSALCATLPAHRHPVPALQQHLSAVCRQKSRSAGTGRGLFDDPGIPAVEALRREGAGVHQRHLHRPCECPDQGVRFGDPAGTWPTGNNVPKADCTRHGAGAPAAPHCRRGRRANQGSAVRHPRHRQCRGGHPHGTGRCTVPLLRHMEFAGGQAGNAHHQPGEPPRQLYQRGRRGLHPLPEKHHGSVDHPVCAKAVGYLLCRNGGAGQDQHLHPHF